MTDKFINNKDIPVIILAGGPGVRMGKDSEFIPKPMVEINGHPCLLYIMLHYAAYGFRKFVISGGLKIEMIKEYISSINKDLPESKDWEIKILDSGVNNMTGSRLAQAHAHVEKSPFFCLTYGDTISDVDLAELISFHIMQKKMASLVAVHPPIRFRILGLYGDENNVRGFSEKPILQNDFINGGYYVMNKEVFSLNSLKIDQGCTLENEVLEQIVQMKELCAFRHLGYWQHMDTESDRKKISEWLKTSWPFKKGV
jgi:glucose-1-phosphate cytidylyltransferase